MPLPKYVNLSRCIPDPHRRPNHIYHALTDETFHVDEETYGKVAQAKAESLPPAGTSPVVDSTKTAAEMRGELATLGVQASNRATKAELVELLEGARTQQAENPPPVSASHDYSIEELRTMASDLELDLPEDADEATLREAIDAKLAE